MTGGQDDDGTEVRDLTDEALALILAVEVPDPGDLRDPGRPYTTDRIHVLRDLPRVRRPEGFETD